MFEMKHSCFVQDAKSSKWSLVGQWLKYTMLQSNRMIFLLKRPEKLYINLSNE